MPQRRITTFRIDEELLAGLRAIQERDGITTGEQVRRAIRAWLESKDAMKPTKRRAAASSRGGRR